jgi:hypothetical protein
MNNYIKPLSALLTIATLTGILMHDTKLDSLMVTAALPAVVIGYGATDVANKFADAHTHVQRVHINPSQPGMQPRGGEDRKYITGGKRLAFSGSGSNFVWPSV